MTVNVKPPVDPPGPKYDPQPTPTPANYVHCLNCGRPWGAIGPYEEAEAEVRAAWSDWVDGGASEPTQIQFTEVVKVGEASSNWWAEKFGCSPEPGWWSLVDIHDHGIPEWATSKLKRHPAVRISNCCEIKVTPRLLYRIEES